MTEKRNHDKIQIIYYDDNAYSLHLKFEAKWLMSSVLWQFLFVTFFHWVELATSKGSLNGTSKQMCFWLKEIHSWYVVLCQAKGSMSQFFLGLRFDGRNKYRVPIGRFWSLNIPSMCRRQSVRVFLVLNNIRWLKLTERGSINNNRIVMNVLWQSKSRLSFHCENWQ